MSSEMHLTLMIGPAVPVPAPQSVIDALTSVQVNSDKERSGFQLTFAVNKKSPLLTTMLPAGYFDPIVTRVVIIATVNGLPSVLMDGIVTRQELAPSNEPGQSTLTVTGEDLSVLMDIVQMPFMRFPAQPVNVQRDGNSSKVSGIRHCTCCAATDFSGDLVADRTRTNCSAARIWTTSGSWPVLVVMFSMLSRVRRH